jgi:DNA-binding Xre family transcriptional regulator
MSKKDLRIQTGVSTAVIAKLGRGANLTTDILIKICDALQCDLSDIMELEREQIHSAKWDGDSNG